MARAGAAFPPGRIETVGQRNNMAWLLAALLGGFVYFNSQATPERAAEMAQKALQEKYPGTQVTVEMEGKSGANVVKGKFKRIKVEMARLKLDSLPFGAGESKKQGSAGLLELNLRDFTWNGMPIESGEFRFKDLRYDLHQLRNTGDFNIVRCGPSTAMLRLDEGALQSIIGGKLKDVPGARLLLVNGNFHIVGEKEVLGVSVPFDMTAVPEGRGPELHLTSPQVKVGGIGLPAFATKSVLQDVNPIFVFDPKREWPFEVRVSKVTAEGGKLTIVADLPFRTNQPAAVATRH